MTCFYKVNVSSLIKKLLFKMLGEQLNQIQYHLSMV